MTMIQDTDITIDNDVQQLVPWKINERFIMKDIQATGCFSSQELKDINTARLHLQVVTLSDISIADGTKLTFNATHGIRDTSACSSKKYNWPRIPQLNRRMKTLWKKAIIKAFTDEREQIQQQYISSEWAQEAIPYQTWWISQDENRVYEKQDMDIIFGASQLQDDKIEGTRNIYVQAIRIPVQGCYCRCQ